MTTTTTTVRLTSEARAIVDAGFSLDNAAALANKLAELRAARAAKKSAFAGYWEGSVGASIEATPAVVVNAG